MADEFDYAQQTQVNEQYDRTYAQPVGAVFPTFFVGVGGCGCQIVQRIKEMLASREDKDRYSKLVQFVGIDTDQDDLKELDLGYKFLISDFPKGEFVALKTGREYRDPDPFFCQWWPDWYATRPDSTKGAGQIRLESRLSLYYQLEADRGGLIEQFNEAIVRSKDHDNPFRQVRPPLAYCHIFGSVAGGTGSGGFLTLAYLFRELLNGHRLQPVMVGHFLLPTLFYRKVRPRLHEDIRSNGYAALKEIEWFMTLGYNNNPRMQRGDITRAQEDRLAFNYNPNAKPERGNQSVSLPPFDLVNIIDEPGDFSLAEPKDIYPAIAGVAYVQLFSPILGERESEEDNYYKKIKHLENGFSLNYGSYGLSMLVLPDRDILNYCELEMAEGLLGALAGGGQGDRAKMLDEFVVEVVRSLRAGAESGTADEARLAELKDQHAARLLFQAGILEREVRQRDPKLLELLRVGWPEAVAEVKRGFFQAIEGYVERATAAARKTAMGRFTTDFPVEKGYVPDKPGKDEEFDTFFKGLCNRLVDDATKSVERVREGVKFDAAELEELFSDVRRSGSERPGPMAETLALIAAQRWLTELRENAPEPRVEASRHSFDEEAIRQRWHHRLKEVIGKDDWEEVVPAVIQPCWQSEMTRVRDAAVDDVVRSVYKSLLTWIGRRLEQQSASSAVIREVVKRTGERKRRALTATGGMSDEFVFDDEVFRGVRTRERHWTRLFRWLVKEKVPSLQNAPDIGFLVDRDQLKPRMSTAFELQQEIERQLQAAKERALATTRGARAQDDPLSDSQKIQVVENTAEHFCRRKLVPLILGERSAGDDRGQKGLMIDECLELEARWELEELFIRNHLLHYSDAVHDRDLLSPAEKDAKREQLIRQFEFSEKDVRTYIKEKINFVANKARVLARLRLTESSDVDPFVFVCMHGKHYRDEKGLFAGTMSLRELVYDSVDTFRTARPLPNWLDEKRVAFFAARSGLPVHNFYPVNGELKDGYERIYREYVTGPDELGERVRDFPSHIDKAFEDPEQWDPHFVLPSLDPARELARREGGVSGFAELFAYDILRCRPMPAAGPEGGDTARDRSFQSSLRRAIREEAAAADAKDVWYLAAEPPRLPPGFDPIMDEERRPFEEALGDRLDRAFERYRSKFQRSRRNRDKQVHLEELVAQNRKDWKREENPDAIRKKLQDKIRAVRDLRDEQERLLEDGARIGEYVQFLRSFVDCLVGLYRNIAPDEE